MSRFGGWGPARIAGSHGRSWMAPASLDPINPPEPLADPPPPRAGVSTTTCASTSSYTIPSSISSASTSTSTTSSITSSFTFSTVLANTTFILRTLRSSASIASSSPRP